MASPADSDAGSFSGMCLELAATNQWLKGVVDVDSADDHNAVAAAAGLDFATLEEMPADVSDIWRQELGIAAADDVGAGGGAAGGKGEGEGGTQRPGNGTVLQGTLRAPVERWPRRKRPRHDAATIAEGCECGASGGPPQTPARPLGRPQKALGHHRRHSGDRYRPLWHWGPSRSAQKALTAQHMCTELRGRGRRGQLRVPDTDVGLGEQALYREVGRCVEFGSCELRVGLPRVAPAPPRSAPNQDTQMWTHSSGRSTRIAQLAVKATSGPADGR